MIKTRDVRLTPDQIRSIRVQPGEILHCAINLDGVPPHKAKEHIEFARSYLLSHLPAETNLLVTSDKLSFTIIQP